MKINEEYFKEIKSLMDRDVYDDFREKRVNRNGGIDRHRLFKRLINVIFLNIRDAMIEDEEGCYIQGLGYFCFITERFQRKQKSIFLKYNVSNGYFFPDSHCKGLYMEETCFVKPCSYRKYAPNFKLTQTMSEQLQSHKEIVTKINRSRYIDEFN